METFAVYSTTAVLAVLHLLLLIAVVRAWRAKPNRPFALLVAACIAYTLARGAWFASDILSYAGLWPFTSSNTHGLLVWRFYSMRFLHAAFMIFMILALVSFIRGRHADTTPTI